MHFAAVPVRLFITASFILTVNAIDGFVGFDLKDHQCKNRPHIKTVHYVIFNAVTFFFNT